jgi:hypothetical protein
MLARLSGMTNRPVGHGLSLLACTGGADAKLFRFSITEQLDAPPFESHLTVYAGKMGDEIPEVVLRNVLAGRGPFRLSVRGIQCSDEFTKTVFVQSNKARSSCS